MNKIKMLLTLAFAGLLVQTTIAADSASLQERFVQPPPEAQTVVFWTWANSVKKEGITRDLEAMARVGVGRAILSPTFAHGATVNEGGVVFLSPEWLALFRFALDEAARLGIKITGLPSNGWYQGGPWVTPEMGAQMLVWSETPVSGPAKFSKILPVPNNFRKEHRASIRKGATDHLKPVAVLAFQRDKSGALLADSLVNLSAKVAANGQLTWDAPAGQWVIYRFGYLPNMVPMKQDSPGYGGLQIDHLSRAAVERLFAECAMPLIKAAGPHVGKTLDRLHEDSMELGHFDWTGDFAQQFQARRGYDLIPWLPALTGARFAGQNRNVEKDFTEVVDELLVDEHYGTLRKLCHEHGLKLQTEGGEVAGTILDKGAEADVPMGEFWNARNQESDLPRAFNMNTIFAAHVYGQQINSFESFTTAQHWMELPSMLKALANEGYSLGLNQITIHGFPYSRPETPPPGDVYFAGTHFNPGVTWWRSCAKEFTTFLNRCQAMLLAGRPVVDLLYLDGDTVQEIKYKNDALTETKLWKYDAIPADLLVKNLSVSADGRLALPHGQTYRVLVVADADARPAALQRAAQLLADGATVWFQVKPADAAVVKQLGLDRAPGLYSVGKGKLLLGKSPVAKTMEQCGIAPAFSYATANGKPTLLFTQRREGTTDFYFVANNKDKPVTADCSFRVEGMKPELWNPVTGEMTPLADFQFANGLTRVPLSFAAHESVFVVFREPGTPSPAKTKTAAKTLPAPVTVDRPWQINFQPARIGLPTFDLPVTNLFLWNLSADARIRGFAGTGIYKTTVNVSADWLKQSGHVLLDLGKVPKLDETVGMGRGREENTGNSYELFLAEVSVNGSAPAVLWCAPYQADVTKLLRGGENELEIHVINTWHNWRVATQYHATSSSWDSQGLKRPPTEAGLLGPVTLRAVANISAP